MFYLARSAPLTIILLYATTAYTQPDIQLQLLNPVGFMAPGQVDEVFVEVINPIGSGVTIERIGGGGYGMRNSTTGQLASRYRRQLIQRSSRCQASRCIVAGDLPLRPGQSALFAISEIHLPADIPLYTEIGLSRISLKLEMAGTAFPLTYYTDYEVVRVVTADGQGDMTIFDTMDIISPQAGTLRADIGAEFEYPRQIAAGDPFDLAVTLTNRDSAAIEVNYRAGVVGTFNRISGDHARSFRFIPCQTSCLLDGIPVLETGQSFTFMLGSFHYENDLLFEGELVLDGIRLHVNDIVQRQAMIELNAEPLQLSVVTANGRTTPRPDNLPWAQPLIAEDLAVAGDGLVIYDPNTGYQWLKVTATRGYTFDDIQTQARAGGRLGGFRLATSSEVEELVLNHLHGSGVALERYALYAMIERDSIPAWQSFLALFGVIPSVNTSIGVTGFVADNFPGVESDAAFYTRMEVNVSAQSPGSGWNMISSSYGLRKLVGRFDTPIFEYTGYWLVR